MNLINAFPEVEIFFSSAKFNDKELLSFLKDIDEKYQDIKVRKSIHGLIALKIMQYETFSTTKARPEKNNIIARSKAVKVKKDQNLLHPLVMHLKNLSINNIALSLEMRVERMSNLLQQQNIFKYSEEILSDDEFFKAKDMLSSFLYALERKGRSFDEIKRIKYTNRQKSIGKGYDVYSKIIAQGGTGKLIYIRKV